MCDCWEKTRILKDGHGLAWCLATHLAVYLISQACAFCGMPAILYHLELGVDISLNNICKRKEKRGKTSLIHSKLRLVAEQCIVLPGAEGAVQTFSFVFWFSARRSSYSPIAKREKERHYNSQKFTVGKPVNSADPQ